jgi:hypothetical protein
MSGASIGKSLEFRVLKSSSFASNRALSKSIKIADSKQQMRFKIAAAE